MDQKKDEVVNEERGGEARRSNDVPDATTTS